MYLCRSGNSISECYGRNLCRRTAYFAVCILLTLVFTFSTACSSVTTLKPDWKNRDFTCHAVFTPYEAEFSRVQGTFTMILTQPDNLAGLAVVCTPDGKYTISCGDALIPLSDKVAAGLGNFPEVLSGISGKVELDKEGLPCTLHTISGDKERTVHLTNFSFLSQESEEGSANTQ